MRKQYNIVAALSLFCSINASAQFSASYPNHDGSYVSSTFFNQYPDLFNTLVEKPKAAELFKFPEPDISYATGKINLQILRYQNTRQTGSRRIRMELYKHENYSGNQ